MRILIVDDEKPARYALAKALDRQTYDIVEADSGQAAIGLLRQQPADLVILDLNMPRMDGQAVLEQLSDLVGSIDFIVVTADDSVSSAVQCMRLGAVDLRLTSDASQEAVTDFSTLLDLPLTEAKAQLVEAFERQAIERALSQHGGNVSAAARQLGIHRQSLQQKMTQPEIRAERSGS